MAASSSDRSRTALEYLQRRANPPTAPANRLMTVPRVRNERTKQYVAHGHVLNSGALALNFTAHSVKDGVSTSSKTTAHRPLISRNCPASIQAPASPTSALRLDSR